ncbi:MAG: hypothetical protein ABW252_23895 [Polyangiales bacterium]
MRYLLSFVLGVCGVLAVGSGARASSHEEKRACVEASTRGQTARDEGRLLEAREHLLICARDPCPAVVRKSCAHWLGEVEQRTPSVLVRVADDADDDVTDAQVAIDGVAALLDGRPIPLDPGPHVISATAPDGTTATRKVLLAENEKSRVIAVRLRRPGVAATEPVREPVVAEPDAPKPVKPVRARYRPPLGALIVGGLGLASLGAATGFGIAATMQRRDLDRSCGAKGGGEGCTDLQMRAAKTNARVTDYALGVGGGLVAFAAAWAVYTWSREPASERPMVGLVPTRDGVTASLAHAF